MFHLVTPEGGGLRPQAARRKSRTRARVGPGSAIAPPKNSTQEIDRVNSHHRNKDRESPWTTLSAVVIGTLMGIAYSVSLLWDLTALQ